MIDQMVQAARSGRQNIAEGSRAAATTSQTELRLINVVRASLEELLPDYEDYLRHRHLPQWDPEGPEAMEVRNVPRNFQKRDQTDPFDPTDLTDLSDTQRWALYSRWLDHDDPTTRANATIFARSPPSQIAGSPGKALQSSLAASPSRSQTSTRTANRVAGIHSPVTAHSVLSTSSSHFATPTASSPLG